MCCIFCRTKSVIDEKTKKCFDAMIARGPDSSALVEVGGGVMGFHRLSIMGLDASGMQPFKLNGRAVVCNGEIYGFRELKKSLEPEYDFKSNSDCEILLPLYEKYGVSMFGMIDAEYALVIYDGVGGGFVAARDPIGIRSLFYGYDGDGNIMFSSEARGLVGLTDKIFPFPPGHYYKEGKFVSYRDISVAVRGLAQNARLPEVLENIHSLLVKGVVKRLDSDAPLGFLLSGGLDSSLVCAIAARELKKPIKTFAIGMEGDAIDLKYARQVADYIGSNHTDVIMTANQVVGVLDEVVSVLGTYDITTVRASVGMFLLCKYIHMNTDVKVLLTGEVSDELFGYKYTDFAPDAAAFQAESQKRVRELYAYDVLRADRCISDNSLEARVPFGDLDFVSYVMSIKPELKLNTYGMGKYLLRKAFEGDYLPHSILYREKAAFSDAVGHSMVDIIKEYAEGLYTDAEFIRRAAQYSINPPFTKESLLYRELFEKHYVGQAHMIPDFWMPNKAWKNCNVTDPSARVLANYGSSGV